jgi:CRP/FNR family cyclic AMP-dependent transcriptional regulator
MTPTDWDVDALGYLASLLVLATFSMRGMVTLRVMAIASNLAFIGYAAVAGIHPVLLLHALLLPMNAWRLAEIVLGRSPGHRSAH